MKIAYFVQWGAGAESGVFKKIVTQVTQWERMGNDVKLFVLGRQFGSDWEDAVGPTKVVHSSFKTAISGVVATNRLKKKVTAWNPDVIYARTLFWPACVQMSKRCPLVLEINSDDLAESRLRFGMGLQYNLMTHYNLLTRRMLLRAAAGIVYVTSELSDRPAFSWIGSPKVAVRNGCDVGKVVQVSPNCTSRLGAFFLGSVRQAWQGVDEIISYAAERPEIDFHIVGPGSESLGNTPSNVIGHGEQDAASYRTVAEKCDVAIGPLALYRKGLSRATALKVPEYLAMGLPVILAYAEEGAPDPCDYLLVLPNKERALRDHDTAVMSFINRWKDRRVARNEIMWCDVSVTELQRINFLQSVLDRQAGANG